MTKSAGTAEGRRDPADVGFCAAVRPATSRAKAIDVRSREYVEMRNMFFSFGDIKICDAGCLKLGYPERRGGDALRRLAQLDCRQTLTLTFLQGSETDTRRCVQHVNYSDGDLKPTNVTVLNECVSGTRTTVLKHRNWRNIRITLKMP